VEAEYYRALMREVDEMQGSIVYWLKANYRKVEPQIVAQDASPASVLSRIMEKLTAQWRTRFNEVAAEMARRFVRSAQSHTDGAFSKHLRESGFSVTFKPTEAMRDRKNLLIEQNVGLIKSIGADHLKGVEEAVYRSAMAGRDLATLTTELQERYGVTKRRAAFIARDQNNKASSAINRARQMSLGITEAEWAHSHGGKHPRESHVKAGHERLRYRLDKGAYIDGEWVFPGELPNCRCVARPIIPGFDD